MEDNTKKIAIIGASGFGREVADIAIDQGYEDIVFLATEPSEIDVMGFPLLEDDKDVVLSLHKKNYEFAIGIGDPHIRKAVVEKYPFLNYPNLIHSSVTFGYMQKQAIENKKGNIITAGCRFTNSISFGDFGVINLNVTIGHDCIIEDFVSIMPSATISGNIHIKEGAFIGCNSSIVQGKALKKVVIGVFSTVGMGSVVIRNVKDGDVVIGNPARKLK